MDVQRKTLDDNQSRGIQHLPVQDSGGESTMRYRDSPKSHAQQKWVEKVNNSPKIELVSQFQAAVDSSVQTPHSVKMSVPQTSNSLAPENFSQEIGASPGQRQGGVLQRMIDQNAYQPTAGFSPEVMQPSSAMPPVQRTTFQYPPPVVGQPNGLTQDYEVQTFNTIEDLDQAHDQLVHKEPSFYDTPTINPATKALNPIDTTTDIRKISQDGKNPHPRVRPVQGNNTPRPAVRVKTEVGLPTPYKVIKDKFGIEPLGLTEKEYIDRPHEISAPINWKKADFHKGRGDLLATDIGNLGHDELKVLGDGSGRTYVGGHLIGASIYSEIINQDSNLAPQETKLNSPFYNDTIEKAVRETQSANSTIDMTVSLRYNYNDYEVTGQDLVDANVYGGLVRPALTMAQLQEPVKIPVRIPKYWKAEAELQGAPDPSLLIANHRGRRLGSANKRKELGEEWGVTDHGTNTDAITPYNGDALANDNAFTSEASGGKITFLASQYVPNYASKSGTPHDALGIDLNDGIGTPVAIDARKATALQSVINVLLAGNPTGLARPGNLSNQPLLDWIFINLPATDQYRYRRGQTIVDLEQEIDAETGVWPGEIKANANKIKKVWTDKIQPKLTAQETIIAGRRGQANPDIANFSLLELYGLRDAIEITQRYCNYVADLDVVWQKLKRRNISRSNAINAFNAEFGTQNATNIYTNQSTPQEIKDDIFAFLRDATRKAEYKGFGVKVEKDLIELIDKIETTQSSGKMLTKRAAANMPPLPAVPGDRFFRTVRSKIMFVCKMKTGTFVAGKINKINIP